MKTLVYQYWDGPLRSGNENGAKMMAEYAKRIGADYKFEHNANWQKDLGKYTAYYGCFKPIFDEEMSQYDYVLFADTDVVPVDGLTENIFDQFIGTDLEIGICEEWNQPAQRAQNSGRISNRSDNIWCEIIESRYPYAKMPRTKEGWPRVFNSGVVVYSKAGMQKFRDTFVDFKTYIQWVIDSGIDSFYQCDQPYLHGMLEIGKFNWTVMDYKWNSSVHHKDGGQGNHGINDLRKEDTNFVHIQLRGADWYDRDTVYRVVNMKKEFWRL